MNIHKKLVILTAAGIVLLFGLPASAATFVATAFGCDAQSVTTIDAPASASSSRPSCKDSPFGYGASSARANSFGLGADAEWFTECCGAASAGSALASVMTNFMIIGPPGVPEVSLNLQLKGGVGGGTVTGESQRRIEVSVGLAGANFSGFMDELARSTGISLTTGGTLAFPPRVCVMPSCDLRTAAVPVLANVPNALTLTLYAFVGGSAQSYGRANAFDTLTFPIGKDVFNLPDGYTAVIYGMNVENNRVVVEPPVGVPEPGALFLLGLGLAGIAASRRRY